MGNMQGMIKDPNARMTKEQAAIEATIFKLKMLTS